jgi:hypothetical protein
MRTSKIRSVTVSTGWSNRYGSTGTIASPVTVGPHALTRGLATFANAFFACLTAVWMVNAGSALRSHQQGCSRGRARTYIDAMDWKAARLTATMPTRVGSEKCVASSGEGPLR